MPHFRQLLAGLLALACLARRALARIRIGQTAGLKRAVAASVKEASDGARLHIDAVNARGGIGGQLVSLRGPLVKAAHDLGGLEPRCGPDDHTGLDFADLSMIGSDGRFRR